MASGQSIWTLFERFLKLFTKVRPGEGKSVFILFWHGFLILFAYYLIRPVRESLILTCADAEVRSYSAGAQAVLLLVIIPLYSFLFRYHGKSLLIQRANIFFITNLIIFYFLGYSDICLGVPFFIWMGIFNVMVVAQFWAFAADLFNIKSGQRLFAILAVGASFGAWIGSKTSEMLIGPIGPFNLMLISAAGIASTLILSRLAEKTVPDESRSVPSPHQEFNKPSVFGGFGVVFRNRYLVHIALFMLLLNWITSNGEFILAEYVTRWANDLIASSETVLDKGTVIGEFYGSFNAWATMLNFLIQAFIVSRLFLIIGVRGAILILPTLFLIGFGMIGFIPIFSLIQVILIANRSLENSIMLTTRNALYLPTSRAEKYEGKTTNETFFWRFGDMLHAGGIFVAIRLSGFGVEQIVALNTMLAAFLLVVAFVIGRRYSNLASSEEFNVPPQVNKPIPDILVAPGETFEHALDPETFIDADPGDVITLTAHLHDGGSLPGWVHFAPEQFLFLIETPTTFVEELVVRVTATDVDGTTCSSTFAIRHAQWRKD